MPRLLLLIALLATLVWLSRQLRKQSPAQRRHYYWQLGFGATAIAVIVLAATGRLPWIFAVLMALLPAVRAVIPSLLRRSEQQDSAQQPPSPRGDMTREDALQVLGLTAGASRDDIVQAHRQLIQKLHPDRGGNHYLAAQINRAKELLLE